MKKFAKVDPCSKTTSSTAEIIAKNDDVETDVVNDNIKERTRLLFDNVEIPIEERKLSNLDEKIHASSAFFDTAKTIQDVGLLKKDHECACNCCNRYDKMKDYTILFLKDLMCHDTQKFKEICQFFTNLEEERVETCEIQKTNQDHHYLKE